MSVGLSSEHSPIDDTASISVLQLSHWLCAHGGGGIQTYLASLTQALQGSTARCQYAALMPGDAPNYLSSAEKSAVHTGVAGESKLANIRRLWIWLSTQLKAVNVVHIHGLLSTNFVIAALACKSAGVPYVVSTHGSLAPNFLRARGLKAKIYLALIGRPLLRGAICILATSDNEAITISHFDRQLQVQVVPPGVAVKETDVATPEPAASHEELRIAFLGRLAPIKALPILFAAVTDLRNKAFDVHLDIIGDGAPDYRLLLTDTLEELGLQQTVTMHGYLSGESKRAALGRADIFVLPSDSESFGFAAVEALVLGIPVIASAGVGVAATIEAHNCGSIVPTRDSQALSQALLQYQDAALRKRQGQNAYRCARSEFSLETMGTRLMRVYQQAAATRQTAFTQSEKGHG